MFMASSFSHESRLFSSLRAGSLVRVMQDHSFPVLGARPAQIFSRLSQVSLLALSMLAQSMEWPASLSCSDSADSRSQACTDLHCGVHFVPSAQFPCRFTIVLCIKILTFDIVSDPTFFLNRDLVFWSHQTLAKVLEDPLKNLGDPDLARVLLTEVVAATVLESGRWGSGFCNRPGQISVLQGSYDV